MQRVQCNQSAWEAGGGPNCCQFVQARYEGETFVRVLAKGQVPHTRYVRGSNYQHIGVFEDRLPGRAIIISGLHPSDHLPDGVCYFIATTQTGTLDSLLDSVCNFMAIHQQVVLRCTQLTALCCSAGQPDEGGCWASAAEHEPGDGSARDYRPHATGHVPLNCCFQGWVIRAEKGGLSALPLERTNE